MYKIKTSCGKQMKSHRIKDLLKLIEETKGSEYLFFNDYFPMTYLEFSKVFLDQTKSFDDYINLQTRLYVQIDFIDYGQKKEK